MIHPPTLPILAGILIGMTAAVWPQDPPPRFRSSVELVSVDVQVVDGAGRPVAGLEPKDFEVSIGNQRRSVVSAELVRQTSGAQAAGLPGTGAPETGSIVQAPLRRVYIIAVDEHSIRFGASRAAMEAARRFIRRLGPDDLIGLAAYPTGTARIDPTTDHAQVLAALDKVGALFEMPRSRYNISAAEALDIASRNREALKDIVQRECGNSPQCPMEIASDAQAMTAIFEMTVTQSLGGLRQLLAGLETIPGRKILVLVSGGLLLTDRGMGRGDESGRMAAVGELAARTNTTLYALHMDSRFIDAYAERRVSNTIVRDENIFANGLQVLAGAGGGTVFRVQTGSGDPAFERILLETSAQYLLGVEVAPEDRDGRARPIRVQVKRRGVTVRSRSSVVIPSAAKQ